MSVCEQSAMRPSSHLSSNISSETHRALRMVSRLEKSTHRTTVLCAREVDGLAARTTGA